jgi:hypothetical protein
MDLHEHHQWDGWRGKDFGATQIVLMIQTIASGKNAFNILSHVKISKSSLHFVEQRTTVHANG